MQRQNDQPVQSQSGDRVLSLGSVRVHNAHLQSGQFTSGRCRACSEGLEGIMEAPPPVPEPPVVEGDGDDEERDPSLPHGSWENTR